MTTRNLELPRFLVLFAVIACWALLQTWSRSRGQDGERCHKNLQQLTRAIDFYASDHTGRYPQTLSSLISTEGAALKCPLSGAKLDYVVSSDCSKFTVMCLGEHQRSDRFPCVFNERGRFPQVGVP